MSHQTRPWWTEEEFAQIQLTLKIAKTDMEVERFRDGEAGQSDSRVALLREIRTNSFSGWNYLLPKPLG